jgi:hypothetical protein
MSLHADRSKPSFKTAPCLRTKPLLCLRLCATYVTGATAACVRNLALHPATLLIICPVAAAYAVAKAADIDHTLIRELEVRAGPDGVVNVAFNVRLNAMALTCCETGRRAG